MIFSVPLLLLVSALAGVPFVRWSFPRATAQRMLLMSPAVTVIGWALALGTGVLMDIPVRTLWAPFWWGTLLSVAAGAWLIWRRASAHDLGALLVPALAATAVLAPYIRYGLADYPGSGFWDGWSYLAEGEGLWRYARDAHVLGAGLIYDYGNGLGGFVRFISGALIAVFRGVLPLGGDSQNAIGYFLLLCTFAFGCSCYGLARAVLPQSRTMQLCFVVVSTFSGFILNLVFSNNFDQLLGVAISPFVAEFALVMRWRDREAVLLGAAFSALLYIYPELSAVLALPAVMIIAWRVWRERPRSRRWSGFFGLLVLAGLVASLPWQAPVAHYMLGQLHAGAASGPRPGEGLFPSLMNAQCTPGAMIGLYAPLESCAPDLALDLLKDAAGVAAFLLLLVGALRSGRAALVPFALSALIILAAVAFILLVEGYDYGAGKVLAAGWYALALLMVAGAGALMSANAYVPALASVLMVIYVGAIGVRVWQFDSLVAVKDMSYFRGVARALGADHGARIVVQAVDAAALEWALYYLRDRPLTVAGFNHPYLSTRAPLYRAQLPEGLSAARYLISDRHYEDCLGPAAWSGGPYRLYKLPTGLRAILLGVAVPSGPVQQSGKMALTAGGGEVRLSIFATRAGAARFSSDLEVHSGLTGIGEEDLLIRSDVAAKEVAIDGAGHIVVDIEVPAGDSVIRLSLRDRDAKASAASGDTLIYVRQIAVCGPA